MTKTRRVLSSTDQQSILLYCSKWFCDGHLKHGTLTDAQKLFGVDCTTVAKMWCRWCNGIGTAGTFGHLHVPSITDRRKGNGRPLLYDRQLLREMISQMPVRNCTML